MLLPLQRLLCRWLLLYWLKPLLRLLLLRRALLPMQLLLHVLLIALLLPPLVLLLVLPLLPLELPLMLLLLHPLLLLLLSLRLLQQAALLQEPAMTARAVRWGAGHGPLTWVDCNAGKHTPPTWLCRLPPKPPPIALPAVLQ